MSLERCVLLRRRVRRRFLMLLERGVLLRGMLLSWRVLLYRRMRL